MEILEVIGAGRSALLVKVLFTVTKYQIGKLKVNLISVNILPDLDFFKIIMLF